MPSRRLIPLVALLLVGCDLFGGDSNVTGRYRFENEYGFSETVVLRPGFVRHRLFRTEGELELTDEDGTVTGTGSCTRSLTVTEQPENLVETDIESGEAVVEGSRDGDRIDRLVVNGCSFPRPMNGRVDGRNISLDTGIKFPVAPGTSVYSDRFGDPERIVLRRVR